MAPDENRLPEINTYIHLHKQYPRKFQYLYLADKLFQNIIVQETLSQTDIH